MRFDSTDIFYAFRQAKTALFFEQRGVGMTSFARFEDNLHERISRTAKLLGGEEGLFKGISIGKLLLVPKKVLDRDSAEPSTVKIGLHKRRTRPSLEVQVRLQPTVEFAIAETLYLQQYGPALDGLLADECIGGRLDIRNRELSKKRRWIYEYWPRRYEEFRTTPIAAAEAHLERGARVVSVISADLRSFYDSIGGDFLLSEQFVERVQEVAKARTIRFDSRHYVRDTESLLRAFAKFRLAAGKAIGREWIRGVPIGALSSKLIANVALAPLDDLIRINRSTVHFRRYVDDMVIVCDGASLASESSIEVLKRFFPVVDTDSSTLLLNNDKLERPDCAFEIQPSKLRVHHLSGLPGLEFLRSVGRDFTNLVSGRRSFLDGALIGIDAASHLAGAKADDGSTLRVLREVDRVKLERFAASTSLRSLERISAMVKTEEAKHASSETQSRVYSVLDGAPDWYSNLDVYFRLLSLAILTEDVKWCVRLVGLGDRLWSNDGSTKHHFELLCYRGDSIDSERAWSLVRSYLDNRRQDVISASIHSSKDVARQLLPSGLLVDNEVTTISKLLHKARLLRDADLRARDRESDTFDAPSNYKPDLINDAMGFSGELRRRLTIISKFSKQCGKLNDRAWNLPDYRLCLLTRPPSYFDVARRLLYQVERAGFRKSSFWDVLRVVNAIRGTEYSSPIAYSLNRHTVRIGNENATANAASPTANAPRVILGNLTMDPSWWDGSATRIPGQPDGNPVRTLQRLLSLKDLIAKVAEMHDKGGRGHPTLLVLPELSVPRAWLRELATYIAGSLRIALIVGVEYLHDAHRPWVINQVVGVFPGPFGSIATWPWTKRVPARFEAKKLADRTPSLSLRPKYKIDRPRTVVLSPVGALSVLVCSEMIEARRVADLLGRVELVVVPSWNVDTASWDHLVQSVGLQLNSIVAIANDGAYSDCRVWAPLSKRWKRDLARLVSRGVNDVIAVELPLSDLLAFRAQPESNENWRPMPPDWP
jgi:hypothetical protein